MNKSKCECRYVGPARPANVHLVNCPVHEIAASRTEQPGVEVARDIVILDGEGVVLCWMGDRDEALRIMNQMASPVTRDWRVLETATWDITNVGKENGKS